jgi:hypothetical protein
MHRKCVVRHIVHDNADPNDVPIEALHASNVRLMTNFMRYPSRDLACVIIRMLGALANHGDRFNNEGCGNLYEQAIDVWESVLNDFSCEGDASPNDNNVVH